MKEDIRKITNKFFKTNGIEPINYYLIFVLDYDNYYGCSDNMNELNNFPNYNFCFYRLNEEKLYYDKGKELKKIRYNPPESSKEEDEDKKGYIFTKDNYESVKFFRGNLQ